MTDRGRSLPLAILLAVLASPAGVFAQGGPDTFGNTWDVATFDWIDPSEGGSLAGITSDDQEVEVALPWSFFFYGVSYDHVTISDNGALRLSEGAGPLEVTIANGFLPTTGTQDPDIAPFWDDLNISGGGEVFTQHHIPTDRFVVSWIGLPHFSYGGTVTFQVQLMPSGHMEFHYVDTEFGASAADYGASATIGTQDVAGGTQASGNYLEVSAFSPGVMSNSAWSFSSPCVDADGDGHAEIGDPWCNGGDCDDSNPTIYPDAIETCADGIDQNCDGYDQLTDFDQDGDLSLLCGGGDCDDFDPSVDSVTDADGDGVVSCDDCNDGAAATYPGAPETCDGNDNDCDGLSDDLDDIDGDGVTACAGDCDDQDSTSWPGNLEICGTATDNDCDGTPDNLDADNDGYVDTACGGLDCDDADALLHPGAAEVCDGNDTDCDGLDDSVDLDVGGSSSPFLSVNTTPLTLDASSSGQTTFSSNINVLSPPSESVSDLDVSVDIQHSWVGDLTISITSPLGTTVLLSDQNGSDGDNYTGTTFDDEATTPIWAGTVPFTGSYQPEESLAAFDGQGIAGIWTLTIVDNYETLDDGELLGWSLLGTSLITDDADEDGVVDSCGDCDDTDPTVHLGAPEVCGDGLDQDCDGSDLVDDQDGDGVSAVDCGGSDCDDSDPVIFPGADFDADGYEPCIDDCNDLDAGISPAAPEVCDDGVDQNCDGDDLVGDSDGDGVTGLTCGGSDCDDEDPATYPAAADTVCDGVDNDCDGIDLDADADGDAPTDCGGGDCDDSDPTSSSLATELCDGLDVDNDCDGVADLWDLDIGANPPSTLNYTSTSTPVPFTDTSPATDVVTSGGTGVITHVTVSLDISHNRVSDLSLTLESPAGMTVLLSAGNGGNGADYLGTVFDDEAVSPITSGSAPFTGLWSPEGSLADLDGEDPAGSWSLHVVDSLPGEDGSLDGWAITIVTQEFDDFDHDGAVGSCGDCDDANASIYPGAPESCDDGIDQDCDGSDSTADSDGDGYTTTDCGGTDCDDNEYNTSPAALEGCNDGIDNDCDPATEDVFDADGDGSNCIDDCDDNDPLSLPGFAELCNDAQDNDCNPATPDLGDLDGDGVDCLIDCDDTNPMIYPGAPELLCTGVEEDCSSAVNPDTDDGDGDGFSCTDDCDDTNGATYPGALEIPCDGLDNDCDEEIDTDDGVDNDLDGDGATCDVDCDDNDPTRSPSFEEVCGDSIDNDCDPLTSDNLDADQDGWSCADDCDDDDPLTFPGAPEVCGDSIDQDCDGTSDELSDDIYILDDSDSIHIGLCSFDFPFCGTAWQDLYVQDNGRITFGFDNHSSQESINSFLEQAPQIAALWTDLDPSLGGEVSVVENDGDSLAVSFTAVPQFGEAGTANSFTLTLWADGLATFSYEVLDAADGIVGFACAATNPVVVDLGAIEGVIGQGTEDAIYEQFSSLGAPNDLGGSTLDLCLTAGVDADLDGWTDLCGDCDDDDDTLHPTAPELCDGIDNDCNGLLDDVDSDEDGAIDADCGGDDCLDTNAEVHPGATEICNGIDDDCDGSVEVDGSDNDLDGSLLCEGDCDDDNPLVHPEAEEICDIDEDGEAIDNDCNGEANEGFVMDLDGDGYISTDCGGSDCSDERENSHPGAEEICDLVDNDCNGEADDIDADGDGYFAATCQGDDCDDTNPEVHPGGEEIPYDGLDNDCSNGDEVDVDGDGYRSDEIEDGEDCDDSDSSVSPEATEICDDEFDNDCDGLTDGADEECGACVDCSTNLGDARGPSSGLLLLAILIWGSRRRRLRATQTRGVLPFTS